MSRVLVSSMETHRVTQTSTTPAGVGLKQLIVRARPRRCAVARSPVCLCSGCALASSAPGGARPAAVAAQWLKEGIYVETLRVWAALFPMRQILVMRYEDLMQRPREALQAAFDHIGLRGAGAALDEDAWLRLGEATGLHVGPVTGARRREKARQTVDAATYKRLAQFYAPYNKQLAELTGNPRFLEWGADEQLGGAPALDQKPERAAART